MEQKPERKGLEKIWYDTAKSWLYTFEVIVEEGFVRDIGWLVLESLWNTFVALVITIIVFLPMILVTGGFFGAAGTLSHAVICSGSETTKINYTAIYIAVAVIVGLIGLTVVLARKYQVPLLVSPHKMNSSLSSNIILLAGAFFCFVLITRPC